MSIAILQGAGVYYGGGATEAMSCRNEDVYIVGSANSAGQAAMHFSTVARRVVMLARGSSLAASMSQYLNQISKTSNIEVQTGTRVVEVHGESHLEAISIACEASGSVDRVPATALFIFIGAEPRTEWLGDAIARDRHGFILTGPDLLTEGKRPKDWPLDRDPGLLETSIPGIFAIGDVRHGAVRRVASGVGEGSIAVQFVHHYLSTLGASR